MKKTSYLSILVLFLLLLTSHPANAQLSSGGVPTSTIFSLSTEPANVVSVEPPDMDVIRMEDEKYPSPYRFAVVLPVDISPASSGVWEKLPDGSRLWRVVISAPGARALSAYFDRFVLPEGCRVFLYNPSKTQVIGAFTSRNNVPGGYFSTELITGDRMILEYSEPAGMSSSPLIHMFSIDYAYRGVGFLDPYRETENPSGICEVNITCSEGDAWQFESKGAVRIKIRKLGNGYWCSGSLINNARNNHVPYILTADHCFKGADSTDLEQWLFYFNFRSPTCNPTIVPSYISTMSGAKLKAHGGNGGDTGSDFCLVLLDQNVPDTFNVVFNGWNRKDTTSPSGVTIHHPGGDVMKISTYNQPLVTSYFQTNPNPCHWRVSWIATPNGHGVTEGGSSGSPLFDNHKRIVGTLTGGDSSCDPSFLNSPDYYGKFSWSWDKNGTDAKTRLKDWLDPDNTGIEKIDGLPLGIQSISGNSGIRISPNPFTDNLQVKINGRDGERAEIGVVDLLGSTIWSDSYTIQGNDPISISFPRFSPGIYFLRITFPGSVSIVKMIKK